ncbi:MAG: MBL fold metallo-hydrolase [Chloroflexi bacterium]|nr:MBL fold metallo-hydrolase [Chloroflexota bacterium]
MKIRFLGTHNAQALCFAHTCFMLDNRLLFDCGSAASCLDLNEQLALRGIFITHSHYDHIKDMPAIAMNRFLNGQHLPPMSVTALLSTLDDIKKYLFDGDIYSDFFKKNTLVTTEAQLGISFEFDGYQVTPIESIHKLPCIGYAVQKNGHSFYYTGDTATGFAQNFIKSGLFCHVLIAECTLENSLKGTTLHLTPNELKEELELIKIYQGFYPTVFAVHRSAKQEINILQEIKQVSDELNTEIFCPVEDTEIEF